jgi:hypothetical protein
VTGNTYSRSQTALPAGRVHDAHGSEQITFHANNGTAAAHLAIAQWVYQQCRDMGRGTQSNCRGWAANSVVKPIISQRPGGPSPGMTE